jgi:2-polyprenyl-3-methyl-5-hydroxy-6-metoxy-1,4-benzoquinol methylase
MTRRCNICQSEESDVAAEETWVRSNVRAFAEERFAVWRCKTCGSIHARDEVDLGHYYARYPFHDVPTDFRARAAYDNFLRRLRRAGLSRDHRILDFGCGGGNFVEHLRSRGFANVFGFDEYSPRFADRSVLDHTYDCVVAQDVIEHVPSPHALLEQFRHLVKPGGAIVLGTPNASAIQLAAPERTIHALHLPYHRHILSKRALLTIGEEHDLVLERYYRTHYANTLVPFLNSAFYFYYMRLFDNSLDALFEPPRVSPLLLRLPLTLFWGFCGYFAAPETDVMIVLRQPLHGAPERELHASGRAARITRGAPPDMPQS